MITHTLAGYLHLAFHCPHVVEFSDTIVNKNVLFFQTFGIPLVCHLSISWKA